MFESMNYLPQLCCLLNLNGYSVVYLESSSLSYTYSNVIIALLICLIRKMKKENMLPNDEGLKLYKSAITIDSLYNTIKRTPSKSPQDIPGSQSEIILEKCTEIQTT